jgi:hypothetical protein
MEGVNPVRNLSSRLTAEKLRRIKPFSDRIYRMNRMSKNDLFEDPVNPVILSKDFLSSDRI